jgi:hypothetical protein
MQKAMGKALDRKILTHVELAARASSSSMSGIVTAKVKKYIGRPTVRWLPQGRKSVLGLTKL